MRGRRKSAKRTLEDGDGGVDSSSLLEEGSDSSAGSLRSDKDDIDVGGRNDLGLKVAKSQTEMEKRKSALKARAGGNSL